MGTGKRAVFAILVSILSAAPLASAAGLKIGINPKELSFGKVMVDTVSAAKTVKVSNPNSSAISITSIAPSGPFAVSANTCGPMLAAKPATCTVSVTFNPTSETKTKGTKESGTLTITDDAEKSPQKVKLKGTAFGVPPPTPTATPSPTATATISPTPTVTPTATPTSTPAVTISGVVMGGTHAVAGSNVQLVTAGESSYRVAGAVLSSTTADGSGNWTLEVPLCDSDAPVYVVASGGNAGGGSNSAIKMIS